MCKPVNHWTGALLGVLIGACCSSARADAASQVEVPRACGSEASFEAALARMNEHALGTEHRVSITGPDRGGRYRLRVAHASGERELWDRDCRALFGSAVVIVATATLEQSQVAGASDARNDSRDPGDLEASAVSPTVSAAPAPPSKDATDAPSARPLALGGERQTAPATRRDPARTQPAPGPRRRAPQPQQRTPAPSSSAEPDTDTERAAWTGGLGLGAGVLLGLAPRAAPMLELAASAERGAWGVALGVNYVFVTTSAGELGRDVSIDALGGWLAGSLQLLPQLRMRAGATLARLEGRGRGSRVERTDAAWSLGARLELAAVLLHSGPMQFEVGAAGQWAFTRPTFEIEGFGPVHRTPAFSGAGLARLSWSFR